MKTPQFWYPEDGRGQIIASALMPLTHIWQAGAWLRKTFAHPTKVSIKLVVIGNITAGGTGKTPLTAKLVQEAQKAGMKPAILMRGYGGKLTKPTLITSQHSSQDCGDEAKWLSQLTDVVVAQNRGEGANFIAQAINANIIFADDGLQNPSLVPDIQIAVFHGRQGIGNGHIIPAGPLREHLTPRLKKIDAVVITEDDQCNLQHILKNNGYDRPVFFAKRQLDATELKPFLSHPIIAFAGIAQPQNFFLMLEKAGAKLAATYPFPDHHEFNAQELDTLIAEARQKKANLITTEKDIMRIPKTHLQDIKSIPLITDIDDGLIKMILEP